MSANTNIIENVGNAPNVPVTNHGSRIASIHATSKATINCFNGPNSTPLSDDDYAEVLDGIDIENGAQYTINSFNGNAGVGNTNSSTPGTSWSAPIIPVWTGWEYNGLETSGDYHHADNVNRFYSGRSRQNRTSSTFTRCRVVNDTPTSKTRTTASGSSAEAFDSTLSADFISRTVQLAIATSDPRNNVVEESDNNSVVVSELFCKETFVDPDDVARSASPSHKSQKKGRRHRAWWLRKGLQAFEGVKKGFVGLCKLVC
ncbi:hypothetical protein CPB83DRAFT_846270 [Crepidotus variabilis]|uniref:Uncharacterized protein n=1 Tax=Crepidotus variabilis TaxID=179855 RepID=A0A9P6EPS6_9AGAR|nr:hypothetical protein CPB83DRAFT_846270 [Crepidotus variabilis]